MHPAELMRLIVGERGGGGGGGGLGCSHQRPVLRLVRQVLFLVTIEAVARVALVPGSSEEDFKNTVTA